MTKLQIHKRVFGETFGYDLEFAREITPNVKLEIRTVGMEREVLRLRKKRKL